jgi:hypothetical protein
LGEIATDSGIPVENQKEIASNAAASHQIVVNLERQSVELMKQAESVFEDFVNERIYPSKRLD